MFKTFFTPFVAGAVAATLYSVPAQAGSRHEMWDFTQYQMDAQENYYDEQHTGGRWDRREDRADRWQDRREREGKKTPRAARRWERRSQRHQQLAGQPYAYGQTIDHHAGQTQVQPLSRPRGNGRLKDRIDDRGGLPDFFSDSDSFERR